MISNEIALCQWRASFAAVLFETDQARFRSRIADALSAIDARLQLAGKMETIERISIESAQRSLAALEREPLRMPHAPLEKSVTTIQSNASDAGVKRPQHDVGSHVRVALPSGEVVAAEIVVIFTASSRKNILVSFDKQFMRIDPEQILESMSAKA
jgi:hypothetical protein